MVARLNVGNLHISAQTSLAPAESSLPVVAEDARPVRSGPGKGAAASIERPAGADGEDFRLVSISAAHAPSGCGGRDWLVYRIAQGANIITGYRRGDLETASADVETIVTSLNERRRSTKAKPGRKPGARGAAAAPPPTREEPE
jgi:hypothetical protein